MLKARETEEPCMPDNVESQEKEVNCCVRCRDAVSKRMERSGGIYRTVAFRRKVDRS